MSQEKKEKCLIYNPAQIVQVVSNGQRYIRGGHDDMKHLALLENKDPSKKLVLVSIK